MRRIEHSTRETPHFRIHYISHYVVEPSRQTATLHRAGTNDEIPLNADLISVGRGSDNRIVVADPRVSRRHALIQREGQRYWIEDLGGVNGTRVNGRPITEPTLLNNQDVIRVASVEFIFHQPAGDLTSVSTPIEQNLGTISDRLERAFDTTTRLLRTDTRDKIDVYLSEVLENPQQPGALIPRGGYALPDRLEIHEVYRTDAPGEGLERSVVLVLLALASGNMQPAPMIVDGLLALLLWRGVGLQPDQTAMAALLATRAKRERPPIVALLPGPTPATQEIYSTAAADFVGFLIRSYGAESLKEFVRELSPGRPNAAARSAYGMTMARLEESWHKSLAGPRARGVIGTLLAFAGYLRPHLRQVAEIVFYVILWVAFLGALAQLPNIVQDKVLETGDRRAFVLIMGGLIGTFVVVSLTSIRQNRLSAQVSETILKELRLRLFVLLQRLQPSFYETMPAGDIISRTTSDVDTIGVSLTSVMTEGLRVVLLLVATTCVIFIQNWKLAAVTAMSLPFFFITGRILGPAVARVSLERRHDLAATTSALQENLGAQPLVKALRLQDRMISDYSGKLTKLFDSSAHLTYLTGIYGLLSNSIAVAILLIIIGLGGWLVLSGSLATAMLITILAMMLQIMLALSRFRSVFQTVQLASGALVRVNELLKTKPTIEDSPNALPLDRLSRVIQFEHVSFSYSVGSPLLRDLDLIIPAGESVALVGPTGSGKSTILSLLMRFYDPQKGRVTFDGVDLREAKLDTHRRQIGLVFQDTVLFNTSIRDNIRFGNLAATDAEVEDAAKAAGVHEVIMGLPDGYDTVAGERGSRLSGGQRQSVALARALISNPAILLLDEITAGVDPHSEAAITEALDHIRHGRTVISATHRLSSITNADRIYVLDRGCLVEQGTHDELMSRGGLYARLWEEQTADIAAEIRFRDVDAPRLQRIPILANLDYQLLAALAQRLDLERFSAGDVIITEGDIGDKLYLIHKGQVQVLGSDLAGGQRLLAVLREGDYFGEMALLYDMPRSATIRAITPVRLYSLSKQDFDSLLAPIPALHEQLERMAVARAVSQPHSREEPAPA